MTATLIPSKRIQLFRKEIIKVLPKFPNNKTTKTFLEGQSLGSLLVAFINWQIRLVPPGPRNVTVRPTASNDAQWKARKSDIDDLLDKVRRGDDITPHLSLGALHNGYTPDGGPSRWADKDFLLNVMGFHHFHLGTTLERKGFIARSNEVLFAHVTRTKFEVLGLFDHSAFDNSSPNMTPERQRLWALHEQILSENTPPGSFILVNAISTSGHTTQTVRIAQHYAKLIAKVDPQLDDPTYRNALYGNHPIAKTPKLRWAFKHLDLCLADDANQIFFLMARGPA